MKLQDDTRIEYENVLAQFHNRVKLSIEVDNDSDGSGDDNEHDRPRFIIERVPGSDEDWTESDDGDD